MLGLLLRSLFRSNKLLTAPFLRATAVPPGTAEARISYGNSVCLSVRTTRYGFNAR